VPHGLGRACGSGPTAGKCMVAGAVAYHSVVGGKDPLRLAPVLGDRGGTVVGAYFSTVDKI
jgi:hypothetical protein